MNIELKMILQYIIRVSVATDNSLHHHLPPPVQKSKQTGFPSPQTGGCFLDLPQRVVLALIQLVLHKPRSSPTPGLYVRVLVCVCVLFMV